MTQADIEPITDSNIDDVMELSLIISDPPVTGVMEQIFNKLSEAVTGF